MTYSTTQKLLSEALGTGLLVATVIGSAINWCGVASLVGHRASVEGKDTATPDSLLCFSIGLETAGDLIDELLSALV